MTLLYRNLDVEVLNVEGRSYDDKPSLRSLCLAACQHFGDERLTLVEKGNLYALALKVGRGGTAVFTVDELALLRKRVGEHLPALVMGRCFELLDVDAVAQSAYPPGYTLATVRKAEDAS